MVGVLRPPETETAEISRSIPLFILAMPYINFIKSGDVPTASGQRQEILKAIVAWDTAISFLTEKSIFVRKLGEFLNSAEARRMDEVQLQLLTVVYVIWSSQKARKIESVWEYVDGSPRGAIENLVQDYELPCA